MTFCRPNDLDEAVALLASRDWSILAGGTDFYPALGDNRPDGNIMDISALAPLRYINESEEYWTIGALATWSDLIHASLPLAFDGLKLAAREVGSVQIQNRATIVGNLCNASPAADGVPPLLTLDAIVELTSISGRREVSLADFVTGNRTTVMQPDEMVSRLLVPKKSSRGISGFLKLGARKYLVISITMVAARIVVSEQYFIADAAISVGSCSLVAKRLTGLETALIGKPATADIASVINREHFDCLSPIDDIRASATYRLDATIELVRRIIGQLTAGG